MKDKKTYYKKRRTRIYMDASFKNGVTTHHWYLMSLNKKHVIKTHTFKSNEETPQKAELQTIVSAVQFLNRRNLTGYIIFTDCMENVKLLNGESNDSSIKALKWMMRDLDIKVKWVARDNANIKEAHSECERLMTTVMKRKEYASI